LRDYETAKQQIKLFAEIDASNQTVMYQLSRSLARTTNDARQVVPADTRTMFEKIKIPVVASLITGAVCFVTGFILGVQNGR